MSWFDASIMARKGVARGKPGVEHSLTEAEQGTYHYVYGPYAAPVLSVVPLQLVAVTAPACPTCP